MRETDPFLRCLGSEGNDVVCGAGHADTLIVVSLLAWPAFLACLHLLCRRPDEADENNAAAANRRPSSPTAASKPHAAPGRGGGGVAVGVDVIADMQLPVASLGLLAVLAARDAAVCQWLAAEADRWVGLHCWGRSGGWRQEALGSGLLSTAGLSAVGLPLTRWLLCRAAPHAVHCPYSCHAVASKGRCTAAAAALRC